MDQALYQRIIDAYQQTGSVDRTAELCDTYAIKVRKVLITEGLWHSKKSDAVNALHNRGYSASEIADELGMDEKNVQFYLPYAKDVFTSEKSDSQGRVQDFRQRAKKTAEGNLFRDDRKTEDAAMTKKTVPNVSRGTKRTVPVVPVERKEPSLSFPWKGYQLHIELVQNAYEYHSDIDAYDLFHEVEDVAALRALLKTRNGISRDVIVPGGISLHQLSYAILEMFGFMNNHLHHFALPKPLFRQLTEGEFSNWAEMCGVYLHVPVEEDFSDLYWDDDYKQGKSAKAWKRSKYTGIQKNYAVGETYIDSLRLLKEETDWIRKRMKEAGDQRLPQDISMDEYRQRYHFVENNMLLERLKIEDLFRMKTITEEETEAWRNAMRKDIEASLSYIEAFKKTESFRSLEDAMGVLRMMREDHSALDQAIWLKRDEIKAEFNRNPDRVLEEMERDIYRLERQIGDAMHAFDPPAKPITDTLYYYYDYGDGWLFRITCTGIHSLREERFTETAETQAAFQRVQKQLGYRDEDIEKNLEECHWGKDYMDEYFFVDSRGREEHNMLYLPLCAALQETRPVCVFAEGLPLVEDVGGPHGFFEFLRTIHGPDAEEAATMRTWARSLGWKEVVPKPSGLL